MHTKLVYASSMILLTMAFSKRAASRMGIMIAMVLTGISLACAESSDPKSEETPAPQERPRLFHPNDLHPFAGSHAHYFDPWGYHGFGRYAWGYPGWGYAPGYRYGWDGMGYRSHLYFDTFYGILPAPGHGELSLSVGSGDYFGSSISTTQWLSKKHNIALHMGALWETGELWWSGQDYESFTIAPTLYWSNDDTLIYASFEYSERKVDSFTRSSPTVQTHAQKRPTLATHDSDASMSPFAGEIAGQQSRSLTSAQSPKLRVFPDGDHTLQRATIGIDHQVTDFFRIGLNFEATDLKRKP